MRYLDHEQIKPERSVKALFLDRDGVINIDNDYVHRIEDFIFVDGIFDLVKQAKLDGLKVIVVTNQAGIGRGFYTERQFLALTDWMRGKFEDAGGAIDKVYFSPYHPTDGLGKYRKDDYSRKPKPGMILQAEKDFGLALDKSVLIGDRETDMEAGLAAGIGLNILFSQGAMSQRQLHRYHSASSLAGAAELMLRFTRYNNSHQ